MQPTLLCMETVSVIRTVLKKPLKLIFHPTTEYNLETSPKILILSSCLNFDVSIWTVYTPDVGGQRCPDSVRVHCTVSVRQNLKFSVGRVFECPDIEFELDFDRQKPHSKSGQNPDSAVCRRLVPTSPKFP